MYGLIRPYELSVYRAALSLMKNKSDAEDVAQGAFLKALRSLDEYRGEAKFSTWLISITVNEARSRLRRQCKLRMESLDEPPRVRGRLRPALLTDWREVPSEVLERRELRKMLRQAIDKLSPIYREVLLMRDVEECSIEETSAARTISISSVKVRLHRARILLQKEVAPKLKNVTVKKGRNGLRAQIRLGLHLRLSRRLLNSATPFARCCLPDPAKTLALNSGAKGRLSDFASIPLELVS
jgi:RNA polymerase sigma-70 factor, ECF subfamily